MKVGKSVFPTPESAPIVIGIWGPTLHTVRASRQHRTLCAFSYAPMPSHSQEGKHQMDGPVGITKNPGNPTGGFSGRRLHREPVMQLLRYTSLIPDPGIDPRSSTLLYTSFIIQKAGYVR